MGGGGDNNGGGGGRGGIGIGGKGSIGISNIPAGSKKIVLSLKEVVNNVPEAEIYAALKECNMDPNEAVNRLISQDPFHTVKSKRDKKKKENKDNTDFRPQRNPYARANRTTTNASDRFSARAASSHFNSNESSGVHRKAAYKKENETSSSSGIPGNSTNHWASSVSDTASIENKMPTVGMSDPLPTPTQASSGFQSAWGGSVPGQVSMADIVKRGLQQKKLPTVSNTPYQSVPKVKTDSELVPSEHDEWPSIEQPPVTNFPSVLEASAGVELYTDSSSVPFERTNQPVTSQLDEVHESEDDDFETNDANHIHEEKSRGSSLFDDNLYENMNSYQSHGHPFEHNAAEDSASAVADNLQQLSLQNDDQGTQPEEDKRTVIIPDHLQVHTPDCSHLSFGSFGAGVGFSGQIALKNDLEEPEVAENSTIEHLDNRNSGYYDDDHLRNNTDENIVLQANANTGNYDSPSVSQAQPEVLKQDSPEESQANQYAFPSAPGFNNYENTQQQLNATFSHQQQTNSQMQYLSPYSNLMQAYANSLPGAMLGSGVPTAREAEVPYSPFPVMQQTVSAKYSNNTASSISGPSMSMPEQALRAASISTAQPTAQTPPGANVATGPALPQHLAMHPYTQLGPFPNMISYPFVHQSFTYMPQAFAAGNSNYHQSLAAMLPQFKNNASVSSLPQSAAVPSGYGFGNSGNVAGGNFPLNPATAPAGTTIGYDDVLSSQYKDINHLASLQQNDNSAMWMHGHGSRTMPAVPGNTYYSYQGQQSQQPAGFQQAQQQQQSQQQHYGGAHGYANFYQTGMPVEHQQQQQQQSSRDGSQGQQSKQAQQVSGEGGRADQVQIFELVNKIIHMESVRLWKVPVDLEVVDIFDNSS
ncbi:hypothetical protein ACFE04_013852 [Oxalis oulophora]